MDPKTENSDPVIENSSASGQAQAPVFREPRAEDGAAVHRLIERCPPLDTNSLYCNLLQCSHFAPTCVIVEEGREAVGFVSGYRIPGREDTLFVWQVAVDARMRGQKLAARMVRHILARAPLKDVRFIETTITPANAASQSVFVKLAAELGAELNKSVLFERERHFAGNHDDEVLFRIGPFNS